MKEYKKELLGFTAGNFDLLHPGYINCFKDAKNYCDKFIVFLQIDPSMHRKSKYKFVTIDYCYWWRCKTTDDSKHDCLADPALQFC